MASSYVNNLRLNELGTGDASGTWGTITNTNLELIGEALGFGTRAIANASTDNITIADGASDDDRAMYLKLTGGGQACTVTLLPNDVSKLWFMENGTNSALTFTQGSGANVIIPAGDTKLIASNGGGSGAIVYDVFASLNVIDLKVQDDLTVTDDASVGGDLLVSGEVQTANIGFTDGDNAMTIADGGAVTFPQASVFTSGFSASAGATITTADNTTQLTLISTDADNSIGPQIDLRRDSGSPADADVLGRVRWLMDDDAGNLVESAILQSNIEDASQGTVGTQIQLTTSVASTMRNRMMFKTTEAVFNEDGVDLDFRVESNGLTNAFVVDGGNNGIGFGHTPRSDLHAAWTQSFFGREGSLISQLTADVGLAGMSMTQNAYIDSDTGAYGYMTTNEATKIDLADGVTIFSRAASGSAGAAISFSESMRITTGGEVGIGESNPTQYFSGANQFVIRDGTANAGLTIRTGTSGAGLIAFADGATTAAQQYSGYVQYTHGSNFMQFATNAVESMRIDGNQALLINGAAAYSARLSIKFNATVSGANGRGITMTPTNTDSATFIHFHNVGVSTIGSISGNGSNVAYNTSSDYRLKENVDYSWDATTRLKQLKPARFNWIADETNTLVDGFIAHEVSSVVPEAITGEKDATNEDGSINPQGIDQSKIVPLLVKTIQELEARITALEGA